MFQWLNSTSKFFFQGYTDDVVKNLVEFSRYDSSFQLKSVLNKIIENNDTKKADVVNKIKSLVADLDDQTSYLNVALSGIPPLVFAV